MTNPTMDPRNYPGVDYSTLPEHMRKGAEDYIERGYDLGGFLYAVLTNDLVGAFGHADEINRDAMHIWAMWLYNEAPRTCWGSAERVSAWIDSYAEEHLHDLDPNGTCHDCGEVIDCGCPFRGHGFRHGVTIDAGVPA